MTAQFPLKDQNGNYLMISVRKIQIPKGSTRSNDGPPVPARTSLFTLFAIGLFLAIFSRVAQFAHPLSSGGTSSAAVGIERTLETFWTYIELTRGSRSRGARWTYLKLGCLFRTVLPRSSGKNAGTSASHKMGPRENQCSRMGLGASPTHAGIRLLQEVKNIRNLKMLVDIQPKHRTGTDSKPIPILLAPSNIIY